MFARDLDLEVEDSRLINFSNSVLMTRLRSTCVFFCLERWKKRSKLNAFRRGVGGGASFLQVRLTMGYCDRNSKTDLIESWKFKDSQADIIIFLQEHDAQEMIVGEDLPIFFFFFFTGRRRRVVIVHKEHCHEKKKKKRKLLLLLKELSHQLFVVVADQQSPLQRLH